MKWEGRNRLCIIDDLVAHDKGVHMAREFLHLAPGYEYEEYEKQIRILNENRLAAVIHFPEKKDTLIHKEGMLTTYSEDFGKYDKKQVLEICTMFQDKVQIRLEIEIIL